VEPARVPAKRADRAGQGNYYTEPYGKPHTESSQAQDERLGDAFWTLSTAQAKELLGQDVTI
jgi:hypothetical protein